MTRYRHHIKIVIVLLSGLFITIACDKMYTREHGFLEGKISIGPLCPVETVPPDPNCLPTPETYKAYPVSIWTTNRRREIARIDPALDGSYKVELNSGDYLIILETERNRIGSRNLPVEVRIYSNHSTQLNIDIDTGIR